MRRALAALGLVATAVLVSPAIAGALGTSQFTIEPGPGARTDQRTDRLVVTPERGGSSRTSVQLTNRLDRPLELRLEVEPVEVRPSGAAALGGDGRGVSWVDLDRDRLVLAPQQATVVLATIHVPRSASDAERTVGILAEPIAPGDQQTAVIQRLALVLYIRPGRPAPRPVVLIGIALVMAVAVLGAVVWLAPSLPRRATR